MSEAPNIFTLLETTCSRAEELAGPRCVHHVRAAFARGTGGADVVFLAETFARALAQKVLIEQAVKRSYGE